MFLASVKGIYTQPRQTSSAEERQLPNDGTRVSRAGTRPVLLFASHFER
jgi:hypothetical protein